MSCGRVRSVNLERPGERGQWKLPPRPAPRSATCVHTWEHRNALDVVGGPGVQICTGCGEAHPYVWVPDVAVRPALPATRAAEPFLIGEAEWVDVRPERAA